MEFHKAELLTSAARSDQWPENNLPEVIFAGRSNAGKSSLINCLTNRKRLAYTGNTPGKTKLLNFFLIDDSIVFTDAPGYGYAKGGNHTALMFADLIDPYFAQREQLKGMVLVLDIRRIPNADDIRMVEYAKEAGLPMIAACTKADKLSRNQQFNQVRQIAKTLQIDPSECVLVSSETRLGMDEVWNRLNALKEAE